MPRVMDFPSRLEKDFKDLFGSRFPFEWQVAKENVLRNPLFAIACLAAWNVVCMTAFAGGMFVFGEYIFAIVVMECIFAQKWMTWLHVVPDPRALGVGGLASQSFQALQRNGLGDDGPSATLARSTWQLALGGLAATVPPACAIAYAFSCQCLGLLGRRRIDGFAPIMGVAVVWSLMGFLFLESLAQSWDLRTCRLVESKQDAACRLGAGAPSAGFFCLLETEAECEFIILAVYVFTFAAVVVLGSVLLCTAGLYFESRRAAEERGAKRSGGLFGLPGVADAGGHGAAESAAACERTSLL